MTSEELKTARKAKGITQVELGLKLGFPQQSAGTRISDYETGRRRITPAVAVALKSILAK